MAERTVIDTAEWAVPGYTALRDLGTGGFGKVVLARHDATGTLVAIKYLKPDLLDDPGFTVMFRGEAEVLAEMDDPNVVRLFEYVEVAVGFRHRHGTGRRGLAAGDPGAPGSDHAGGRARGPAGVAARPGRRAQARHRAPGL